MGAFQTKCLTITTELMFTKSMYQVAMESQGKILRNMANLIDKGEIKDIKKQEFKFDQMAEAHMLQESGKAIGKIALTF